MWVSIDDCPCTEELWNLGRQDYGALSKQQKNLLMRYFLLRTSAPVWVLQFGVQQWPCDAIEQKPKLVLKASTCLLTYQGDWGVLNVDDNVVRHLRSDQLTEYVRESEQSQSVWQTFLTFAEKLAADLHAPHGHVVWRFA